MGISDTRTGHLTKRIGAVIFDMDGLMLDTERLARVAWDRALADWGFTIPDEVYYQLIGRTTSDVGTILRARLSEGLPFEEIAQHKQEYLDQEIAQQGIPIKPALFELLDWLDRVHLNKAVASSTFREPALEKLRRVGLQDRFDAIIGGDEIRRGKPAPDIFLAAARKLGAPADRCVVLEDSEPGILAATAAGMISVMVPDTRPPSAEVAAQAYRVFPSLIEVKEFLEQSVQFFDIP